MIKMPWTSASCPHFVLEINQKCNISCKGCYKKMDGSSKPLDQVLRELSLAMSKRRIQTVSVAGGEPTLHPRLREIVSNIHGRKLKVVLTTNGLLLTENLLKDLKKAGLDMVMLHVDEGQDRPDMPSEPSVEQIDSLRSVLAEKVAAADIDVGLAVTVYPQSMDRLPNMVDLVLNSGHVNFLFATHYVDAAGFVKSVRSMQQNQNACNNGKDSNLSEPKRTTNRQIHEMLKDDFGLEPFAYLPGDQASPNSEGRPTWMTYFVPVIHIGSKTKYFSVRSNLVDSYLRSFLKLASGRLTFYTRNKPVVTAIRILCNALTSGRPIEGVKFLSNLRRSGARLKSKYLVFENGPQITEEGYMSCCILCPNATIRGNELVPVCMADHSDLKRASVSGGQSKVLS